MALDTTTLKASIKQAFLDQRANNSDPTGAAEDLADKIGAALETWVKTLQITYTTGLADSSGAVSGTFGNTLS